MKDGQKQPEFNAEYIDKLFSREEQKRETPSAAVDAAPNQWQRTRKAVLILTALVAVAVVLGALMYLRPARWQNRCEEVWTDLISRKAFHYSLQTVEKEEKDQPAEVVQSECWQYRNDRLQITSRTETDKIYTLYKDTHRYTKEDSLESPNAGWTRMDMTSPLTVAYSKTLAEAGYVYDSVRSSFGGAKVTYRWLGGSFAQDNRCIEFLFDISGELIGLTVEREQSGNEWYQYLSLEYTFFSTPEDEIRATIRQCYKEATGE